MIKIFHTGDNHLDSAFARLSLSARERERARQRELFAKMMQFVRENDYDLVLISGDLFDSPTVSPETEQAVIGAFSRLSCPVVISPGNHDPYSLVSLYSNDKLPSNVYVFNTQELQVFDFDELGVKVCGYAFMSDEYLSSPLTAVDLSALDGVKLLCAHGELGVSASKYAPISLKALEEAGFRYTALGHIHKRTDPIRIGDGFAAYCGFPEGRAFDEEGEGGALSVTIEDDFMRVERLEFSERCYLYDSIDVSGVKSDCEMIEKISAYFEEEGYDENTAVRLTLSGSLPIDYTPDRSLVERMISPKLLELEIIDRTLTEIDQRSLENDYTLRGEVYRTLKPKLESDDPEEQRRAAEALKVALLAIEGRRISFE